MNQMKKISAIIIFAMSSLMTVAQGKIDKAVTEVEKSQGVSITCTEKRDPETKRLYKMSKVIKFTDKRLANKVTEAIIEESENAIEYTRIDSDIYQVIFIDGDRRIEYYIAKYDKNTDSWVLVVNIKKTKRSKRVGSSQRRQSLKSQNYSITVDGIDIEYWKNLASKIDGNILYLGNVDSLGNIKLPEIDMSSIAKDLNDIGIIIGDNSVLRDSSKCQN